MRLTNKMKENLFNIIKNKSQKPFSHAIQESLFKRFQEITNELNPVMVEYFNTYPNANNDMYFHQNITVILDKDKSSNLWDKPTLSIRIKAPNHLFLLKDQSSVENRYSYQYCPEDKENFKEEYIELLDEFHKALQEQIQYDRTFRELYNIIMTFTTDNALAQAYPEFEQFFLQAGIHKKAKKALPSVTGLPQSLTKYGIKLYEDVEDLEQQIKKEMEND